MCGRYYIDEESIIEMREIINEINRRYYGEEKLATMKTGEIFPTNNVPIISKNGPQLMTWGFPMHGKSQTIINARSETAFERPMFRSALISRRVVVPTTGYFEWAHREKKTKEKYLFRLPGSVMIYLAGIFTEFNMPTGKEQRFTILTTSANDSMIPYHDRMPVYIQHDEIDDWIQDNDVVRDVINRVQPDLNAVPV